jgi:ubiquinone/menaquinone biosynthesis C-methylase UbiE
MSHRVCPWWIGYLLLLPIRRLWQNPRTILGPLVREGMTVLEPGPGMGFFTLDVAAMVGATGRVIALDVQEKMLQALKRRAGRAGLVDRIEVRRVDPERLGVDDLAGRVDLVLAIFVVHEMPDAGAFFAAAHGALKPGGRLFFAEPKGHVSKADFQLAVETAARAGFSLPGEHAFPRAHAVVLTRM